MKIRKACDLILLVNYSIVAKLSSRFSDLTSNLNQYFGMNTSSGSKSNHTQSALYTKTKSLFILFYGQEDLFTKEEYQDTNAIPLGQLEKGVVVSNHSAKGTAGYLNKNLAGQVAGEFQHTH